jgi:hypothetical protein
MLSLPADKKAAKQSAKGFQQLPGACPESEAFPKR